MITVYGEIMKISCTLFKRYFNIFPKGWQQPILAYVKKRTIIKIIAFHR